MHISPLSAVSFGSNLYPLPSLQTRPAIPSIGAGDCGSEAAMTAVGLLQPIMHAKLFAEAIQRFWFFGAVGG